MSPKPETPQIWVGAVIGDGFVNMFAGHTRPAALAQIAAWCRDQWEREDIPVPQSGDDESDVDTYFIVLNERGAGETCTLEPVDLEPMEPAEPVKSAAEPEPFDVAAFVARTTERFPRTLAHLAASEAAERDAEPDYEAECRAAGWTATPAIVYRADVFDTAAQALRWHPCQRSDVERLTFDSWRECWAANINPNKSANGA